MEDLRTEALRRYEHRFHEKYTISAARNSAAAQANYAPIFSEVQSQWRSLGCVALKGGTHAQSHE